MLKRQIVFLTVLLASAFAVTARAEERSADLEKATFAAGCFWGVEKVFAAIPGVVSTRVGYTGGTVKEPNYEQVCSGTTGHAEGIEITYDPSKVSYEDLLDVFWSHHDSTTLNRQGNDTGTQYRSAIFYHSPAQKEAAERSKAVLEKAKLFKSHIVTEITSVSEFYAAEEYHQKYLKKNPNGYCHIQLLSAKIGQVLKEARAKN